MAADAENERVLLALERLQESQQELAATKAKEDPAHLSHWRTLPEAVAATYSYASQGAELCKATATKYTLVGKMDVAEGSKLAKELLQGCELIATSCLVICNDETGCGRAARHYLVQASRAVLVTVHALVQVFKQHIEHSAETLAAQKTGAVWSACDALLVSRVPKGNRNSIRRELFTYVQDCNETLQEFTALIEQGSATSTAVSSMHQDEAKHSKEASCDDDVEEDFDDRYTSQELPVATSSLALVKCSRGTINVALKACESAGEQLTEQSTVEDCSSTRSSNTSILDWISRLSNLARRVGDGTTDLGTCLYPPLQLAASKSSQGNDSSDDDSLRAQLIKQRDAIVKLHNCILDDAPVDLPEQVMEISSKLREAAESRCQQAHDLLSAVVVTSL